MPHALAGSMSWPSETAALNSRNVPLSTSPTGWVPTSLTATSGQRPTSPWKDLEADFEFFDAQDLAHSLAQLGFLVEEGIDESARAHNLEVIAPFFPASWMNKIRLWLTTGKANTITHSLSCARRRPAILLRRPSARDGVLVAKDPHRFGAFLLRMNQFTERDYNEAIADGSRDPDDTRHARAALFRYLFYYDSPNWGSLVGRYWALMFEGHAPSPAAPTFRNTIWHRPSQTTLACRCLMAWLILC